MTARRVLVLRALKLGDLLAAVPALRALRRWYPRHRLDLATPAWLEPLARHAGLADRIVATSELAPVDPAFHHAEIAVNLHGRGPTSTALLARTRPWQLLAFDFPFGPAWHDEEHERARWCRLLRAYGIPANDRDLAISPPARATICGVTLVHPGAASGARRWPVERWAAVAAGAARRGRAVVVTGTRAERPLAEAVARRAGLSPDAVMAGRTTVMDLLALVARARQVLSGDTGIAHMAVATGTASVTLFGPTSPSRWGPPRMPRHVALWAGDRGDPHADRPHHGLLRIGVADVLRHVR